MGRLTVALEREACQCAGHGLGRYALPAERDLPEEFLTALLNDVAVRRSAKGGGPALIAATDTGDRWNVAPPPWL